MRCRLFNCLSPQYYNSLIGNHTENRLLGHRSLGSGGGFDVQDVLRKFTGNTLATGGGGILDTLKGLMGK